MATILNNVTALLASSLEWIGDVLEAVMANEYIVFFLALTIVGIIFRYAKGFLRIR